jgi:gentisate 1,2-dioxygenase
MFTRPNATPERSAFYKRIDTKNLAPRWEVLGGLVTPQPRSPCVPALWQFEDVRADLMEAGKLISARGRAAGPHSGEPGTARCIIDHPHAVLRSAAHPPR